MIVFSETFYLLPKSSKLDLAFRFYEVIPLVGIKWPITLKLIEIGTWELF